MKQPHRVRELTKGQFTICQSLSIAICSLATLHNEYNKILASLSIVAMIALLFLANELSKRISYTQVAMEKSDNAKLKTLAYQITKWSGTSTQMLSNTYHHQSVHLAHTHFPFPPLLPPVVSPPLPLPTHSQ